MRIRFGTESGSVYVLDEVAKTWERETFNKDVSPYVRTKGGEMVTHSPVEKGLCVDIIGPGLEFGIRLITTTPVIWVD